MTQFFITRAELLPPGETTDDHLKLQQEEAEVIERDKQAAGSRRGGLFHGYFEYPIRRNIAPIRDIEDGVDRCPRCAWELEDGVCHSCGLDTSETHPRGGSDSPGLSYYTGDELAQQFWMDEMGEYFDPQSISGSEGSVYGDQRPQFLLRNLTELESELLIDREVARQRREARNAPAHTNNLESRSSPSLPYSDDIIEEEFGDMDGFSAEEESNGDSLNGFIVEDVEEELSSAHNSSQSSHYETDEVTSIIDNFESYSPDENNTYREESVASLGRQSPENRHFYLADDADDSYGSPVQRLGRRRRTRFPQRSHESSGRNSRGESDSTDSVVQPNTRIAARRARRQALRRSQQDQSSNYPAAGESEPCSEGRRGVPIKVESESDSQPPMRRLGRRRGVASRVISDDDDDAIMTSVSDVSAQSRGDGSSAATIGRKTAIQAVAVIADTQTFNQIAATSSPIFISSSSVWPEVPAAGWNSNQSWGESPENNRQPLHLRPAFGPSNVEDRHRITTHARRFRRDPSRSPLPFNIQPSAVRIPPPVFARSIRDQPQSETNESYQQAAQLRASRKAERQALKNQKRRREREQATPGFGVSQLPALMDGAETLNTDGGVRFGNRALS